MPLKDKKTAEKRKSQQEPNERSEYLGSLSGKILQALPKVDN